MVGVAALIGVVVMLGVWIAVELGPHLRYHYTQDVVQIADVGYSTGILTRVFVMLWSAAVGIALFAGALARSRPEGRAFLAIAAFMALLIVDDNLLLHEFAAERLGEVVSVDKPPVLQGIYVALLFVLLVAFRVPLLATPWVLLAAAFGFLGLSALLDLVDDVGLASGLGYYEAGAKYAGILASMLYLVVGSYALIRPEQGVTQDDHGAAATGSALASSRE